MYAARRRSRPIFSSPHDPPLAAERGARCSAADRNAGSAGIRGRAGERLLASYLSRLGFTPVQIGAIATATLFGSAALLLSVGLAGPPLPRRTVLLASSALMCATGVAFYLATGFWALLAVAFLGTLNPSSGDVTLFLPTEQAVLAESAAARDRTSLFAWLQPRRRLRRRVGIPCRGSSGCDRAGSGGAGRTRRIPRLCRAGSGQRTGLPQALSVARAAPSVRTAPLQKSRGVVLPAGALFSLDAFGGGFVVQSIVALWLFRRFEPFAEHGGRHLLRVNLLGAISQLVSARMAARIGHVRTMVYTHLPANAFLLLAGVMPTLPLAACFLLLPGDALADGRPSAAGLRDGHGAARGTSSGGERHQRAPQPGLGHRAAPGWALLQASPLGWPLICGGALKIAYDLTLYARFSRRVPAEAGGVETGESTAGARTPAQRRRDLLWRAAFFRHGAR